MRNLYALTRREIGGLLWRPSLYAAVGVMTILCSKAYYEALLETKQAAFEPVALMVGFLAVFLVPLITMRVFAGETADGTIELLLTAPVGPLEVVLSKFFGCLSYYLVTLLPCAVYIGLLARYGNIDDGKILCTLLGLVLLGLVFIALGLLASALTDNLIVAAVVGVVGIMVLLMLSLPVEQGASVYSLPAYASYWSHFKEVLMRGLLDTRSLIFLLTFPAAMIFLTWLIVKSRGTLSRAREKTHRGWQLMAAVLALTAFNVLLFLGWARLDVIGRGSMREVAKLWQESSLLGLLGEVYAVPLALVLLGGALGAQWISKRGKGSGLELPQYQNVSIKFKIVQTVVLLMALASLVEMAVSTSGTARLVCLVLFLLFLFAAVGLCLVREKHDPWLARAWPTILAAVCGVLLLINVNYLASRLYKRWDLTERQIHTLSPSTRTTLSRLEESLHITVFFSGEIDYQGVRLLERTRELLTEFTSFSPKVRVRYVDAVREAGEANRLAGEMGLPTVEISQLLALQYRGRLLVLPAPAMVREPTWKDKLHNVTTPSFAAEEPLAISIRRLMDTRTTRVYFSAGHGEMDMHDQRRELRAAGFFATALMHEAFDVKTAELTKEQPVPHDCDVLVLAGPQRPFTAEEVDQIREYANGGGRIMVFLPTVRDPRGELGDPLKVLLDEWGGRPRRDFVRDTKNCLNQANPDNILALVSSTHGIAREVEQMVCAVPVSRTFYMREKNLKKHGWQPQLLMRSLKPSLRFVKGREREGGREGPHTVAYTAGRQRTRTTDGWLVPEGRVLVVGSDRVISNLFYDKVYNRAFTISAIHWLAGRQYGVEIEPRDDADRALRLAGGGLTAIWWTTVVGLPEAWFLLAALVWWLRQE